MKAIRLSWSTSIEVNADRSRRDRFAGLLRKLAERIDGRRHFAIRIETEPRIDPERRQACIREGMNTIVRCIQDELRCDVEEAALRALCPQLFPDA